MTPEAFEPDDGEELSPNVQLGRVPQLEPTPDAIAEVTRLRHRELRGISKRLGRMSRWRWDRLCSAGCLLMFGAILGGSFGLIPFLGADPEPEYAERVIYFGLLGMAAVTGVGFGLASLAIKGERDDSVADIKDELDGLLSPYEQAAVD